MTFPATDQIDLMFRALSDRTRLRILNLLQELPQAKPARTTKNQSGKTHRARNTISPPREICVCDLMRVLDLPQAKVSRHLAYLRKAGLVQDRKIQRWMYHRLLPARGQVHQQLLECLAACPDEIPELLQDRQQLGCCVDPGSCC